MIYLSKKNISVILIIILLLFAGIIALTQELDSFISELNIEYDDYSFNIDVEQEPLPEWVRPPRWFRSNAGGMPLEEIPSRFVALRNEYALLIDIAHHDELPEYILSYYDKSFVIEIRILYRNGRQIRTQWILRDEHGTTRLNAVFTEAKQPEAQDKTEINTGEINNELKESDEAAADNNSKVTHRTGFIEIFDAKTFLKAEYIYLENGGINKIEYTYNNNVLISARFSQTDNLNGEYTAVYADYYRYNRSSSLRYVERVFYMDTQIDPVKVTFTRHIRDTLEEEFLEGERFNPLPEFFGNIFVYADSKMLYETDERGRILTNTLYDDEDNIIWVIRNTWSGDRIIATSKTEDGLELLAEFEYNSAGDRIVERNFRNGVIERSVRTEENLDIEDLYLNEVVVLRAVWEDGRKISETRMR